MRSTISPILTVSCAMAGAASARNAAAHAARNALIIVLLLSGPRICPFGRRDALVVAIRHAPLIGAPGRPSPVLGTADLVVIAHLFDLGGVLDHAAVRPDE